MIGQKKLDQSLYYKACELAITYGFVFKSEELKFYYQFNPSVELIILPKPYGGLLICVENEIDSSPIFLDRDGGNLIEPIIEMIAMLAKNKNASE